MEGCGDRNLFVRCIRVYQTNHRLGDPPYLGRVSPAATSDNRRTKESVAPLLIGDYEDPMDGQLRGHGTSTAILPLQRCRLARVPTRQFLPAVTIIVYGTGLGNGAAAGKTVLAYLGPTS